MNRRNFLHSSALTLGALTLAQQKIFAALSADPWKIKMLRNDVGVFTEKGGTIAFLLSKKGIVVVDSEFPEQSQHLIDELGKQSDKPFELLINTHHHGDHTAGNIAFKGIVEHVVAHENSLTNQKNVAEKNNSVDKQLYPDMTFTEDWKLKMGDETIKADYYGAGHTNGDATYHFEKANIIHAGDLMFNKRHPFVDRTAGANMTQWIKDLDSVVRKADKDTIIVFGHSLNAGEETGTVEDVKKFQDYLGKVLAFAEQEIKKGVSKAEFIKNISIPGVTEWTGDGIQRPLTAAYEELTSKS